MIDRRRAIRLEKLNVRQRCNRTAAEPFGGRSVRQRCNRSAAEPGFGGRVDPLRHNGRPLELALRLMLLDKEGIADELRYREAIRPALLRRSGLPPSGRRSLDDQGGSSIHAEVRAVIARTAVKRAQNARHARASDGRKKAARVSRTRPRSPRRLRATRSP